MKNNKKFLFCEFCGFKKIIDDLTNLCVIKNINIQGKIEKNPQTNEIGVRSVNFILSPPYTFHQNVEPFLSEEV